ncbi:UNVERIFIED_CONTAM: hypothetical protein PYX00_008931 [Menopon gallinae]
MMMAAAKENASGSLRQCNRNYKHACKNSSSYIEDEMQKMNESYEAEWDSDPQLVQGKNERNALPKDTTRESFPLSMEGRIALELQQMKEREQELREWRNKIASENCKDMTLPKDGLITSGNEELSSLQTTDDSNYSEYGSEEKEHSLDENGSRVNTPYSEDFMHLRTQSLDSVSSGHSSGSGSTLNERERDSLRRKVVVRPYEDPDEEDYPCYVWDGKETPIEREIRLAREREEELRREKGTAAVIENCRVLGRKMKGNTQRKEAVENDPRGIQQRLATSRIQQEIEEANERERELRTEGKIISTSEETLDSKVTRLTQLVENSITESRHREQKMKRSSSSSQLAPPKKNEERQNENPEKVSRHTFKGTTSKKGVMQQFFSMKGKPFITGLSIHSQFSEEELQTKPVARQSLSSAGDVIVHTRKGYTPVAERIQEELMDNQKREEELRLQRARTLARSQPDLLAMVENEEERRTNWTSREDRSSSAPRLVHSLSNPNLLDDDGIEKVNKRPSNKKFSLLEEWEKRTRESIQKE